MNLCSRVDVAYSYRERGLSNGTVTFLKLKELVQWEIMQDCGLEKKIHWSYLTLGLLIILDTLSPKTTKNPNSTMT